MTRFSDDYEEDFPGEFFLQEANIERARRGKRGRKALLELREALLALPDKALCSGYLADGPVCMVGAYAEFKGVSRDQMQGQEYLGTRATAESVGLAKPLADHWSLVNDEVLQGDTDEERYESALKWVEKELAVLEAAK